ncbi:MAG: PhoX family protein [Actinomycetota bacterium]
MATSLSRRRFLSRSAVLAGGLAVAGPLQAYAARMAMGQTVAAEGYGPLVGAGELALPRGFRFRIISRSGTPMSDGNLTPTSFDGMAAFPGPDKTTVLIRNHENRRSTGDTDEIDVVVPAGLRYDSDPNFNGGNTKLVVSPDRRVVQDFAVLGGTTTNCAGGPMPWGSWITCEEVFQDGAERHGYVFEVDAGASGPVEPNPIRSAGRFVHEAVAWLDGVLYLTEDQRGEAAQYRYLPEAQPGGPGDLAAGSGILQALVIEGMEGADTNVGFTVGDRHPIKWATIDEPDPAEDTVRDEAHDKGAAFFNRAEGCWVGNNRFYFDCTEGGGTPGFGQIWELDPTAQTLTLIYQSPGPQELKNPDNLTVSRLTGDLFICEDSDPPQFIRGLTPDGQIYDFARGDTNDTEFAGATFSPSGKTLFVNQFGDGHPAVTYAIWGPWKRST